MHRGIRHRELDLTVTDNTMMLPEAVFEGDGMEPYEILRPIFDMVWNTFGFIGSLNYDDQGKWVGQLA